MKPQKYHPRTGKAKEREKKKGKEQGREGR